MYATPQGYRDALAGNVAQIDVYIAIGTNIDPTASDDLIGIEGAFLPMSNAEQVTDANYLITDVLATFEADGIKTAMDTGNQAPPIASRPHPPQVGLWSEGISDAEGNMDHAMTMRFKAPHTSALTIYAHGVTVLAATATYFLKGAEVKTVPMEPSSRGATVKEAVTYDAIRVTITKIDRPFTHFKLAEVEFGTSVTYSKDRLTGSVVLVQEWDPLTMSVPLYELDFSILNVLGEFDPDNPNGLYQTIRQDYPVELSYSITMNDGSKYTVPMGRFMVATRKATETSLDVVALDARSALSNNRGGLTMRAGQSFGDMFKGLFGALNIPFTVDEGLFTEYPDQDMDFSGDKYDLLTIMKFIEQYYDIWLVPERIGSIRATKDVPGDDYGEIPPDMVITYPKTDVEKSFNYISVAYGDDTARKEYVEDLRDDPAQLRAQIAINNPLIRTLEKAKEIAGRVHAALFSERVSTEWRGDPAMDVTDIVRVAGKWTQGTPTAYRGLYLELTYNGGLSESIITYH